MAEPHWISYVSIVTGSVGAVTGIAGAIMGFVGYRRSNKLKALDLRLELRKAVCDAHITLRQSRELILAADQSRMAVLAARGLSQSGNMKSWKGEVEASNKKLVKLHERIPAEGIDYKTFGTSELESELVAVHRCKKEIEIIRDKYISAMHSDEESRKLLLTGIPVHQ